MPPALTWLVRHGQSTSNAGLPATGHGEVPLTALGQQQAREVAHRVQRQPDLLIVSPFLRAHATAEPIRERWPLTPMRDLADPGADLSQSGAMSRVDGRDASAPGSRRIGVAAIPTTATGRTPKSFGHS